MVTRYSTCLARLVDKSLVDGSTTKTGPVLVVADRPPVQPSTDSATHGELAATRDRHAAWFARPGANHSTGASTTSTSRPAHPDSLRTSSPPSTGATRLHRFGSPTGSAARSGTPSARPSDDSSSSTGSTAGSPSRDGSEQPAAWAGAVAGLTHAAIALGLHLNFRPPSSSPPCPEPLPRPSRRRRPSAAAAAMTGAAAACLRGDYDGPSWPLRLELRRTRTATISPPYRLATCLPSGPRGYRPTGGELDQSVGVFSASSSRTPQPAVHDRYTGPKTHVRLRHRSRQPSEPIGEKRGALAMSGRSVLDASYVHHSGRQRRLSSPSCHRRHRICFRSGEVVAGERRDGYGTPC